MNTYHVYTVHMNPALNGSSALERFEPIEVRNGKMFDFYPGLPHIQKMALPVGDRYEVHT